MNIEEVKESLEQTINKKRQKTKERFRKAGFQPHEIRYMKQNSKSYAKKFSQKYGNGFVESFL